MRPWCFRCAIWQKLGQYTTITDAANKDRVMAQDGLGRMTAVWEDTSGFNYQTGYVYDANGNLVRVGQGTQNRYFTYDGLSRLTAASNPESGTTYYAYDGAGNLTARTDSRSITTWYSYDALNRIVSQCYSDSTPCQWWTYDLPGLVPNSTGRLVQTGQGSSSTTYASYDALGNVTGHNEQTAGQTYFFSYAYNLAGALTSETYPSGRSVTTGYVGNNEAYSLTGSVNGQPTNYVTQTAYYPQGSIYYYVRGNTVWHANSFNDQLQPTESYDAINNQYNAAQMLLVSCANWGVNWNSYVYDICPHASASNDNGTLQGYTEYHGGGGYSQFLTFSQAFSYDGVNRLSAVSDTGGWARTFGYDQWGNGWLTGSWGVPLAGNTPTSNIYAANNQMNGQSYDAAGNQLSANGNTAAYDAENRLISVTELPAFGGGTETFAYDGNGQRVQKTAPDGAVTAYVYDAFGQLAAEYSSAGATRAPCTTCYLSYDHLGNVRLVMDQNANVMARHDYLPFGEEIRARRFRPL